MHNKQYLVLAILFGVALFSVSGDPRPRKGDASSGSRKPASVSDRDASNEVEDYDSMDSMYLPLQYSPYGPYSMYQGLPNNYLPYSYQPPNSSPYSYEKPPIGHPWYRTVTETPMPSPSVPINPYTGGSVLKSGQQCHSLIDEQYPVFSDMCGAVPQARYTLPNSFGHYDRWQLSHTLTALMGSSTDQTCIRSLRLLLCPMLFQPCRMKHEPPLVLPCKAFCSAVKSQCSSPALDSIPCDVLPYSSDLCPVNQPFNPFFSTSTSNPSFQTSVPSPSQTQNAATSAPPTASTQTNTGSSNNVYNTGAYQADNTKPIQSDPRTHYFQHHYQQAVKVAPYPAAAVKPHPASDVHQPSELRNQPSPPSQSGKA